MDFIIKIYSYIQNMPYHMEQLFAGNQLLAYLILWLNLFLETGIPIFSFLPSNSLVLASAAYTQMSNTIHILPLSLVVVSASLLADHFNFFLGTYFGRKYRGQQRIQFIKPKDLAKANHFFETHGKKSFLVSRFIPFLRAAMPFAAGFSETKYKKIAPYFVTGILLWNVVYLAAGALFGNVPAIQKDFSILILFILGVTTIPTLSILFYNIKKMKKGAQSEDGEEGEEASLKTTLHDRSNEDRP